MRVYRVMLGHRTFKYFHPITTKKDTPEDKDPPEGNKLPSPSGSYLLKVICIVKIINCQL